MNRPHNVLLVDLNNFARYPTMPIGYFARILRKAGCEVRVFAPLMIGIHGVTREPRPNYLSLLLAKFNYFFGTSSHLWIRVWREWLASRHRSDINARHAAVVRGFRAELLRSPPDAVMISTYLIYRGVCEDIAAICEKASVPLIIGGSYFAQNDVIDQWIGIRGLNALVAGEVELQLPAILESLLKREDLSNHEGLFVQHEGGATKGVIAKPNEHLDAVPFPDYSDFPWSAYPNRIVPIITGRGCGWGVCTFCSDVTSTAGRTYRSRSPENVISELGYHHGSSGISLFVFTDLKLNSNVEMWRAICTQMQSVAPEAKWVGAIHAGVRVDEGLSLADLQAAADSGCVRLTTGLESGSQRMTRLMRKGTRLETTSRFLHDATSVGISCRCTMILGYPGETVEDVHASADFLDRHHEVIERVMLNRFQIMVGTSVHRALQRKPNRFQGVRVMMEDQASALVTHEYLDSGQRHYRKAVMRLFSAAHRINQKSLTMRAQDFEGVM